MRVLQISTYVAVEKEAFGKTVIQALEVLQLAKRYISGRSDVKQHKNQAHSLSGYQDTFV